MKMTSTLRAGVAAMVLGGVLLASAGGVRGTDTAGLLPAGEPAPMFAGVDIDGKPFSLEEELAGGPVLLVFWSIF